MAQPTVTIEIYANTAWNVILAADAMVFCGADSADGALTAVTVPASGNAKICDELWWEDNDGTDYQCTDYEYTTQEGDASTGTPLTAITDADYLQIKVVGDESSAGNSTLWDTTGHTTTAFEILTDTSWSNHCWIIHSTSGNNAVSARAPTGPIIAGYKSQDFASTTYEYKGATTNDMSAACSTTSNYLVIHCKIPDDATGGAHTAEATYEYFYT